MSEPVWKVTFSLAADLTVPDVATRHDRANIADSNWPERLAVVGSRIVDDRVIAVLDVVNGPLRTKDQKALRDRVDRFCNTRPEFDLIWLEDSKT